MSDPSRKLRRRKCRGKIKYFSRRDARIAAQSYERDFHEMMDAYYCRDGHWHIGHSSVCYYFDKVDKEFKSGKKRYG